MPSNIKAERNRNFRRIIRESTEKEFTLSQEVFRVIRNLYKVRYNILRRYNYTEASVSLVVNAFICVMYSLTKGETSNELIGALVYRDKEYVENILRNYQSANCDYATKKVANSIIQVLLHKQNQLSRQFESRRITEIQLFVAMNMAGFTSEEYHKLVKIIFIK